MRKKCLLILIPLIVLLICILVYKFNSNNHQKKTMILSLCQEIRNDGYNVDLMEYQKSRSEDLPYKETPNILIVNEEEWFVFIYSSSREAEKAYNLTLSSFLEHCYLKEQYIIYYIGENSETNEYIKSIIQK